MELQGLQHKLTYRSAHREYVSMPGPTLKAGWPRTRSGERGKAHFHALACTGVCTCQHAVDVFATNPPEEHGSYGEQVCQRLAAACLCRNDRLLAFQKDGCCGLLQTNSNALRA